MTTAEQNPWRPSRRRLREASLAALAPLTACAVALGALTAWTGSGAAGSPARVEVEPGTIYLPTGDRKETAAFFRITNSGGSDDRLTSVTSPVLDEVMLGRHTAAGDGAATMRMLDSAAVPAREGLTMAPLGVDVMARTRAPLSVGDRIPFVLTFRYGGRVSAEAVVVRPTS
ncbi:copper chaperone PCu(A)C [Streptomyces sp. NPDC041068]|uniref:copper chaperone PCu(A)C n=1 Tax=Streptomyces sp. NPDC041068 TaxID=3155130 RepID=UPI0033F80B74